MTCCCIENDLSLTDLAEKTIAGSADLVDTEHLRKEVDDLIRRWRMTEEGAVELAALLDTDRPPGSVRPGQWQMEDATEHVRLKRKLMGLNHKPLVKATPKRLQGEPAPTLRNAPLKQAGITEAQVREIETKLSGDSLEKFVRELEKEACAISCCFIKAAAAAMVHADVHVECPLDDVMRLFSFEVTKKSYAT